MPKFNVHVCRIANSHLFIPVEAENKEQAMRKAEAEAGNHSFPVENTCEYIAQGATETI